ncbi:MAG: hypothetical protein KA109_15410 [Saprospiraceae bacterium]|jgi:hypothetical protein|nr:hypothetical protein [Saprospiraceae bacterium]MBK6817668.1 hypothetical protein [Saprospiraceae bacterium]MBK8779182.1 hypothetical protein [Saprospiraceae bacterium]MBK9928544.1 hypothetical protein [Saprospiraceae bacterium]MBL0110740.1 hypothetical protein [Saprospiraceae bacterium]
MNDFTQIENTKIYPSLTLTEIASIDIDRLAADHQLKMNWVQKLSFRFFQKRLSRQIIKGRLNKNVTLQQANDIANRKNSNRRGKVSLIIGAIGLLTMFSGFLALLAIPLFIGGLVVGILGISKDEKKTMAIVGTVFNGLMILLILMALIALTAGGLRFA